MAIRILVLAPHLSRAYAGAAHATIDIVNALARSDWATVTAFAHSYDPDALAPDVRVIQRDPPAGQRLLWRAGPLHEVPRLARTLATAGLPAADVCYTQSTDLGLAYRQVYPDTPVVSHTGHVIVEREYLEEAGTATLQGRLSAYLLARTERRAYRMPRWRHVVSTRLVARQRETHYGLRESFFAVRPLGVDRRRFDRTAAHEDVRARLGISPDAYVVVTAARLVPWKNLGALLRAAALSAHRPAVVIVGRGPEAEPLAALSRELGIADRVHLVGHTHPAPYLAAADVFALPSLIESFGMVYAEAMLMGLPCIGLRNEPPRVLSSASDVIPEGVAGYGVSTVEELRDRLDTLAGDAALRRRLGEQAYALAAREYSVERYCAFLHELIAQEGWT